MNNNNNDNKKNDDTKHQGTDQSKQATAPVKDPDDKSAEKREAATGSDKK